MALRIAVSGSAGTGKSTLARRVAEVLGVPYIPEGMREHIERTGVNLHSLGHEGLRRLVLQLWAERREAEAAHASFVADRSSYDFAAFWLFYRFAEPDADTDRLFADALAPRYDAVFLLPWGGIPLMADGLRNTNPWVQLHYQLVLEGVLGRWGQGVVRVEAATLEERADAILTWARARC
jgi:nicotinamide riboside kinase